MFSVRLTLFSIRGAEAPNLHVRQLRTALWSLTRAFIWYLFSMERNHIVSASDN
jgi:hypothetical protein